jgi:hypothetical protein
MRRPSRPGLGVRVARWCPDRPAECGAPSQRAATAPRGRGANAVADTRQPVGGASPKFDARGAFRPALTSPAGLPTTSQQGATPSAVLASPLRTEKRVHGSSSPGRSLRTRLGRVDLIRADAHKRLAKQVCRRLSLGLVQVVRSRRLLGGSGDARFVGERQRACLTFAAKPGGKVERCPPRWWLGGAGGCLAGRGLVRAARLRRRARGTCRAGW